MKPPSLLVTTRFIRYGDIVINLNNVVLVEHKENDKGVMTTQVYFTDGKPPYVLPGEQGKYLWDFWLNNSRDIEKE
jgi:hypothetical protein